MTSKARRDIEKIKSSVKAVCRIVAYSFMDTDPNNVNIANIKKALYSNDILSTGGWEVELKNIGTRQYQVLIMYRENGANFKVAVYLVPSLKDETNEYGIVVAKSFAVGYSGYVKSQYEEYINKYGKSLEKNSKLTLNKEKLEQYNKNIAAYEQAKKDCLKWIDDLNEQLKGASIEVYTEIVDKLVKDIKLSDAKDIMVELAQKPAKYQTNAAIHFERFYLDKENKIEKEFTFNKDQESYERNIKSFQDKALRALCYDYLIKTNSYKRKMILDRIEADSSVLEMPLEEAISKIDPNEIALAKPLHYCNSPSAMLLVAKSVAIGEYEITKLEEVIRSAYRIAYALLNVDKNSKEELELLGKYIFEHNFDIPETYIEYIGKYYTVYDAWCKYLKVKQKKKITSLMPIDKNSVYYYKTTVYALRLKREKGKIINATKGCTDEVYEALKEVMDDFNRESTKANFKNILIGDPGKSFVFEFYAFENPADWDGRSLGRITKLANDKFRNFDGDIVRFDYDEFAAQEWSEKYIEEHQNDEE